MKCLGKYNKWCQIRPDCSPFKQSARNSRGLFLPEPLPETWNRPGDDVRLDARLHWLTQLIRYSEGRVRSAFLAGVGDWMGGRGLCQPAGNDPTGEAVGTAATAARRVCGFRRQRGAQEEDLPCRRDPPMVAGQGGLRARQSPLRPLHPLQPRRGSVVPAGPPQRKEEMRRGLW